MQTSSKVWCYLAVIWSVLFPVVAIAVPATTEHSSGSAVVTGIMWFVLGAAIVTPFLAALTWYFLAQGRHLAASNVIGVLAATAAACLLAVFVTPAEVLFIDLALTAIFLLAARLNEKTAADLNALRASTEVAP